MCRSRPEWHCCAYTARLSAYAPYAALPFLVGNDAAFADATARTITNAFQIAGINHTLNRADTEWIITTELRTSFFVGKYFECAHCTTPCSPRSVAATMC